MMDVSSHRLLLSALAVTMLLTTGSARSEAADACFAAVQAESADAERLCSDRLAGLRYDGATSTTQQQALASTLNNRAMARMAIGDLDGAATDFEEALALRPDAWAIHLNHGNFLLRRRDPGAALEAYGRVAELAPTDSEAVRAARTNSVLAWRALGNTAAAQQALMQAGSAAGTAPRLSSENPTPAVPAPQRP